MRLNLCSHTVKDTGAFCTFSSVYSEMGMSPLGIFNGTSFPQAMLKTITGRTASAKAPHTSGIAVPTAYKALIWLYLFSVVNHLIRGKAVNAYMVHASSKMIGLAAQTLVSAFTENAGPAGLGFVAQLIAL